MGWGLAAYSLSDGGEVGGVEPGKFRQKKLRCGLAGDDRNYDNTDDFPVVEAFGDAAMAEGSGGVMVPYVEPDLGCSPALSPGDIPQDEAGLFAHEQPDDLLGVPADNNTVPGYFFGASQGESPSDLPAVEAELSNTPEMLDKELFGGVGDDFKPLLQDELAEPVLEMLEAFDEENLEVPPVFSDENVEMPPEIVLEEKPEVPPEIVLEDKSSEETETLGFVRVFL